MSENGTVNELLEFAWNKNGVLHFTVILQGILTLFLLSKFGKTTQMFPKNVENFWGKMISVPKAREIWKQQNDNQPK